MHMKVFVRRGRPGWYYVDLFGWRPFENCKHGGWMCLNAKWFRHHWRTVR